MATVKRLLLSVIIFLAFFYSTTVLTSVFLDLGSSPLAF
jgi:hypothetical protein